MYNTTLYTHAAACTSVGISPLVVSMVVVVQSFLLPMSSMDITPPGFKVNCVLTSPDLRHGRKGSTQLKNAAPQSSHMTLKIVRILLQLHKRGAAPSNYY